MKKLICFTFISLLSLTACGSYNSNDTENKVVTQSIKETTEQTTNFAFVTEDTIVETTQKNVTYDEDNYAQNDYNDSLYDDYDDSLYENDNQYESVNGVSLSDFELIWGDDWELRGYTFKNCYYGFSIYNTSDSTEYVSPSNFYLKYSDGEYKDFHAIYQYDQLVNNHLLHDIDDKLRPGEQVHCVLQDSICTSPPGSAPSSASLYYKDKLICSFSF